MDKRKSFCWVNNDKNTLRKSQSNCRKHYHDILADSICQNLTVPSRHYRGLVDGSGVLVFHLLVHVQERVVVPNIISLLRSEMETWSFLSSGGDIFVHTVCEGTWGVAIKVKDCPLVQRN